MPTELLYLLGAPTLSDFLSFVKRRALNGEETPEDGLVEQWRVAARRYQALETEEAGLAEKVQLQPLPAAYEPVVKRLTSDPGFAKSWGSLPIAFGLIELDHLVAFQHHVDLGHARHLQQQLGHPPNEAEILELCMPANDHQPEVRVTRNGDRRFVIESTSADLRILGVRDLPQAWAREQMADGPVARAIGVLAGFGAPYLNVVRHANRMVLNNGFHRAWALRALGVTHVPCLIQGAEHADELALAGGSDLTEHYNTLFKSPRPPLFKDFFDPQLTTMMPGFRRRTQLVVTVDVQTLRVAE
jgi:hypothetical protein